MLRQLSRKTKKGMWEGNTMSYYAQLAGKTSTARYVVRDREWSQVGERQDEIGASGVLRSQSGRDGRKGGGVRVYLAREHWSSIVAADGCRYTVVRCGNRCTRSGGVGGCVSWTSGIGPMSHLVRRWRFKAGSACRWARAHAVAAMHCSAAVCSVRPACPLYFATTTVGACRRKVQRTWEVTTFSGPGRDINGTPCRARRDVPLSRIPRKVDSGSLCKTARGAACKGGLASCRDIEMFE